MSDKHFSSGCVFGRMIEEPKIEKSKGGKEFLSFKVSVMGQKSGSVSAFCRMWTPERYQPFLDAWRDYPARPFMLKGFFSQYKNDKNEWFSTFTIIDWQQRDLVDPRAVFILRGVVDQAQKLTDGGQRILLNLKRENQEAETLEVYVPGELLLDEVAADDFVELKGYVRQQQTEDEFGGSSGPIRAFVHELKIMEPF